MKRYPIDSMKLFFVPEECFAGDTVSCIMPNWGTTIIFPTSTRLSPNKYENLDSLKKGFYRLYLQFVKEREQAIELWRQK